jgi:hypothetical protein
MSATRPPAGDPVPSDAAKLLEDKQSTATPADGATDLTPSPRRAWGRTPWEKLFGDPPRQVARGTWALTRNDLAAFEFAGRQLERELAEDNLRFGGMRRDDVARVLGVTRGQVDHAFAQRRHLSVPRQVQLGRALLVLSVRRIRQETERERASGRWEDDFDDDLADDDDEEGDE